MLYIRSKYRHTTVDNTGIQMAGGSIEINLWPADQGVTGTAASSERCDSIYKIIPFLSAKID